MTYQTKHIQNIVQTALFAALIAVGAMIRFDIPLSPVPITLQTFFILLAGILLRPLYALGAAALYIFAGIAGLPVFAGGTSGFAVILGPSGGFIIGFLPAALLMSLIVHMRPGHKASAAEHAGHLNRGAMSPLLRDILATVAGTLIIYAIGYPWIVLNLGWDWRIGLGRAVLPYVPGDVIKIIAAVLLAIPARRILEGNARS